MKNDVTNEGSMGLNVTDDPLKVKEFQVFLRIRLKEWTYNKEKFLLGGNVLIFEIEEPSSRGLLSAKTTPSLFAGIM